MAALGAPGVAADAGDSAGLVMVAALVVFSVPLIIWLRYAKHVNRPGGLYAFVEAAAGRRVALVQAGIWIFSYLLYVIYTTVQIVYDLLPQVLPGVARYQTMLALLIPVALAGVMVAGRTAALIAIGVIAVGQLALLGILDGITLANVATPASSFGTAAGGGSLAKASVQTSLLYVCGSLPLFLGGELARPARTMRRGLVGAYALSGLLITLAVAPLAASPGLMGTAVPGVNLAQQFSTSGVANAIGIGIAASIAGVMACEYLALTRVINAASRWPVRRIAAGIGALVVLAAPFSLIDPNGFYDSLLQPSLVALWLSQLIVFAVYPRFAIRHGARALPAWSLGLAASGLAIYGLYTSVSNAAT